MREIEDLQKIWDASARLGGLFANLSLEEDGLVLGAGAVLVRRDGDGALELNGEESRVLTLLSVAHGRPVDASILGAISRASKHARAGDLPMASMHIALAGLPRLANPAEAARQIFIADGLLAKGVRPQDIFAALEFDPALLDELEKFDFNPGEPRNPKHSGQISGRWTREIEAAEAAETPGERPDRFPTAGQFLSRRLQPVGPIPDYPETGRDAWRASNDLVFQLAVDSYNSKYGFASDDPRYWTALRLKAQAMVESGGNEHAFETDPLQVNKPGDWPKLGEKATIVGLTQGQVMTPETSARAALEWLRYKGSIHDTSGSIVGWKGAQEALAAYNGDDNPAHKVGTLLHSEWYGRRVMALESAAAEDRAEQSTVPDPASILDDGD